MGIDYTANLYLGMDVTKQVNLMITNQENGLLDENDLDGDSICDELNKKFNLKTEFKFHYNSFEYPSEGRYFLGFDITSSSPDNEKPSKIDLNELEEKINKIKDLILKNNLPIKDFTISLLLYSGIG